MRIVDLGDLDSALPILAGWHHAEWAHLNPGRTLQMRTESMRAHLGGDPIPSTFVALDVGDEILGSASLIENDMHTRTDLTPWLASVYVAPQHRRTGIGTALVRHVVRCAGNLAVPKLYLFTPDRADFYATLGWSLLESAEYMGHRVTIMAIDPGTLGTTGR